MGGVGAMGAVVVPPGRIFGAMEAAVEDVQRVDKKRALHVDSVEVLRQQFRRYENFIFFAKETGGKLQP